MNNHSHPIAHLALAFAFGISLAIFISSWQKGGMVYAETVSEHVVLNGSTDGRYHTCGYETEDGVTEHLDAYGERCPDDVRVTPKPTVEPVAPAPEPQPAPIPAPQPAPPVATPAPPAPTPSKIGGTTVPFGLTCEEDEVIGFDQTTPVPHALGCVHIDTLSGG